jgi:predicted branched-subunit amino acid permease
MAATRKFESAGAAFLGGLKAALSSVFFFVIGGTYVGIGALAHDFGFSAGWMALSTVLVWAGPAQVILISALGSGSPLAETALAVSLTGVRLLPMVVALLPLLRAEETRLRALLLPTHLTSVSMWVESLRLLPAIAREHRIAFCNGVALGLVGVAVVFGHAGFYLAAGLPPLFAGGLLFLTPISFLLSTARNARALLDKLSLLFGLALAPLLAIQHVQLDLMWSGVIGGTLAYGIHRLREAMQ